MQGEGGAIETSGQAAIGSPTQLLSEVAASVGLFRGLASPGHHSPGFTEIGTVLIFEEHNVAQSYAVPIVVTTN